MERRFEIPHVVEISPDGAFRTTRPAAPQPSQRALVESSLLRSRRATGRSPAPEPLGRGGRALAERVELLATSPTTFSPSAVSSRAIRTRNCASSSTISTVAVIRRR